MSWSEELGGKVRVAEIDGEKGRGVLAARALSRGETLEIAPCLLVTREEYAVHCKFTIFNEYLYQCRNGDMLLPLGLGCLFNHAERPNVDFRLDRWKRQIAYYAARDIEAGEELTIFYGTNLWFTPRGERASGDASNADDDDEEEEEEEALPFPADVPSLLLHPSGKERSC